MKGIRCQRFGEDRPIFHIGYYQDNTDHHDEAASIRAGHYQSHEAIHTPPRPLCTTDEPFITPPPPYIPTPHTRPGSSTIGSPPPRSCTTRQGRGRPRCQSPPPGRRGRGRPRAGNGAPLRSPAPRRGRGGSRCQSPNLSSPARR